MKILFSSIDISGKPETSFKIIDEKNSSSDSKEIRDAVAANIGFVNDIESDFAKNNNLDKKDLRRFVKYLGQNNVKIEVNNISDIQTLLAKSFEDFKKSIDSNIQIVNGGVSSIGAANKILHKDRVKLRLVDSSQREY